MKSDLLNGLMKTTVDDSNKNSSDAEKIIESACLKSQQTCQNQEPNVFVVRKTVRAMLQLRPLKLKIRPKFSSG